MYTADAVRGFMEDIKRIGRADDVAVMIFTEFGRRVEENGSLGTDHGTATPMFIVGKGVKGGFYGQHPSLTDLDDGNMKMTTDFRRVYATVIKEWLGCDDTQAVLKGRSSRWASSRDVKEQEIKRPGDPDLLISCCRDELVARLGPRIVGGIHIVDGEGARPVHLNRRGGLRQQGVSHLRRHRHEASRCHVLHRRVIELLAHRQSYRSRQDREIFRRRMPVRRDPVLRR